MFASLNKEIFKKSLSIIGLKAHKTLLKNLTKEFKGLLLLRSKIKHIRDLDDKDDKDKKLVLLSETIEDESQIPERLKTYITKNDIEIVKTPIELDFDNYTYDEVMKQIIPANIPVPSAFERIGHICHLNLRDEQLPYKNIIGQTIIEKKGPGVRTVLNKIGKIDTVFRTFNFELLAGDNDYVAEVKENECTFKFNFADVYWNSRLQHAHGLLVETFNDKDIVCDMFAGVGPFAIPAVKLRKCRVHANDLNPHSVKYMDENAKINKIPTTSQSSSALLSTYNMDARDFVRKLILQTVPPVLITQVVMNLPSTSVEFLDVFKEIFLDPKCPPPIPPPTIHVYTFVAAGDNIEQRTKESAEQVLQHPLPDSTTCIEVRDVSPLKRMMKLSFKMPTLINDNDKSTNTTNTTSLSSTTTTTLNSSSNSSSSSSKHTSSDLVELKRKDFDDHQVSPQNHNDTKKVKH